jgi:hypothetical protein
VRCGGMSSFCGTGVYVGGMFGSGHMGMRTNSLSSSGHRGMHAGGSSNMEPIDIIKDTVTGLIVHGSFDASINLPSKFADNQKDHSTRLCPPRKKTRSKDSRRDQGNIPRNMIASTCVIKIEHPLIMQHIVKSTTNGKIKMKCCQEIFQQRSLSKKGHGQENKLAATM